MSQDPFKKNRKEAMQTRALLGTQRGESEIKTKEKKSISASLKAKAGKIGKNLEKELEKSKPGRAVARGIRKIIGPKKPQSQVRG